MQTPPPEGVKRYVLKILHFTGKIKQIDVCLSAPMGLMRIIPPGSVSPFALSILILLEMALQIGVWINALKTLIFMQTHFCRYASLDVPMAFMLKIEPANVYHTVPQM